MSEFKAYRGAHRIDQLGAALLFVIAGLAASRLIYEGVFPRLLWLGRPLPVFIFTATFAAAAWLALRGIYGRLGPKEGQQLFPASAVLSPLLLNLLYLFDPAVNLAESRFVFAGSLWLSAVFLARYLAPMRSWRWLGILFIWLALVPLYLLTMPHVAGRADTFEFQVVIPQLGIAHPTGYPLYILLGRLFAALPFGSIAWRINLASAVFAALAAAFLFLAGRRFWKEPLAALLAAVLFGLAPTLWSQAIVAEVYALHALFVAAILWLMAGMLAHGAGAESCTTPVFNWPVHSGWQRPVWLLALLVGLGLTNHLTSIIMIPAALLTVWLAYGRCLRSQGWKENGLLLLKSGLAFLLPLLLYAYLPLRWQALQNEPMGWARFVDWVIGGRFQGALQLTAWLNDMTRYEIVWRLLLAEWGWFSLLLALIGMIYAANRSWRVLLVLLLICSGYIFYALNYHVPDLAVFLIPAHAIIALFWGAGLAAVLAGIAVLLDRQGWPAWRLPLSAALTLLLVLPALMRTVQNWPDTAFQNQVALQAWGQGVLSMPLVPDAAILADSEKIAPLYYLQQAEGYRPDLDIMVLPDEAAYRAELDARVAAGQTLYLARFLPGLEGVYHLRSQGPLIEVSRDPMQELPADAASSELQFEDLRLLGYDIKEPAAVDAAATAVTLYWQMDEPAAQPHYIYVRWSADGFEGLPAVPGGTHPAGNTYPTVAFHPHEVVPDYHLLPRPATGEQQVFDLQVAVGPQFATSEALAWQTVTSVALSPAESAGPSTSYRAQNGQMLLTQASFPAEIRPGTPLPLIVAGYAPSADLLEFTLSPADAEIKRQPTPGMQIASHTMPEPLLYGEEVDTNLPNGRYHLFSRDPMAAAICGWLASPTAGCILGEVVISGVPLAKDAANFDDKLALLAVDLPAEPLQPGGMLPVHLRWQSIAALSEDYTVFLQVLNDQDQIVGQVDAWPLQGTYPTSQWPVGEIVDDPYEIQLAADLPPGDYRLQVGLYLLATLRRLPLLDAQGQPIDDKVIIHGLTVQ